MDLLYLSFMATSFENKWLNQFCYLKGTMSKSWIQTIFFKPFLGQLE